MPILTTVDYPAIRAALDSNLATTDLPNSMIAEPIFAPAAEAELLGRVPTAASMTGEDAARVKRALIYLTAARLAPSVVRVTSLSVQTRDLSYSRQTFDPAKKAAELRAAAEAELGALLVVAATEIGGPFTAFTLARGNRGY